MRKSVEWSGVKNMREKMRDESRREETKGEEIGC